MTTDPPSSRPRPLVFLAGPMTTAGEPGPNLHAAASVAADLLLAGCDPVVPHMTWILHAIRPDVPVEAWRDWCLGVLARCDALYRLDGESVGADIEVARAMELGVPVFWSLDALESWRMAREGDSVTREAGEAGGL